MKSILIIIMVLAGVALLTTYITGLGQGVESNPAGAGEVEVMAKQEREIPPIDVDRPAVTETAAFALG